MTADHRPERIRRSSSLELNRQPPPQPRGALSPEAPSRLAQQIATILRRIRARATVVLITSGEGAERFTTAHRVKLAYIYVRQSTAGQVRQLTGKPRADGVVAIQFLQQVALLTTGRRQSST